jgi:AcrR family transcriptional regulator
MMIKATFRVLARQPGSVSVNDILAEASLSTRSFYRQFRSKSELLLAMIESESDRMIAELNRRVTAASDPKSALVEWIDQHLELCYEPRKRRRIQVMLMPEVVRAPGYAGAQLRLGARQREPLVEILEAGAADGSFTSTQPAADAPKIYDMVLSIVMRAHGDADPKDVAERTQLLDFIGRALGIADPG